MLNQVDGQICGRDYEAVDKQIVHFKDAKYKGKRYHVDGLIKRNGQHIRFKSKASAERHIRNMRLAKD